MTGSHRRFAGARLDGVQTVGDKMPGGLEAGHLLGEDMLDERTGVFNKEASTMRALWERTGRAESWNCPAVSSTSLY